MALETTLHSIRLNIELVEISDIKAIHNLHSRPEVDKFNTLGIPKNIKETELITMPWILENEKQEPKVFTFSIKRKVDLNFLGLIALKLGNSKYKSAEAWYKLHPDYWGNGFATEALQEIIRFGFDTLKLHRIEAGCAIKNNASINVLKKAGMIREGRKRKVLPLKTGWADNFEYAILQTDKMTH